MKIKVAVVSLRCNPAFIQHLVAFAKAIRELGHEVGFILDPGYRKFPDVVQAAPVCEPGMRPLADSWTHAIFLNVAVENRILAQEFKKNETKILYVYHEPWQVSIRYAKEEGILPTLRMIAAHRATVPILRIADLVILESECGLNTYVNSDARFNDSYLHFPQIYDDEAPSDLPQLLAKKRYFGYIGSLCKAHGFDQYIAFMRRAFQEGTDLRFLIASRNPLPRHILKDDQISKNLDRIEIRCGRALQNSEMNLCYAESFCVWSLYRRSTQSGVLPKAFMFGTPAIASKVGSFPEYVKDGLNGRFVSAEDHDAIGRALDGFRQSQTEYAEQCRKSFLETFYYRSRMDDLERILQTSKH